MIRLNRFMLAPSPALFVLLIALLTPQWGRCEDAPCNVHGVEYGRLFKAFEYSHLHPDGSEHGYRYRLFTPDTAKHKGKLPLIVWLHGAPGAGSDNCGQLALMNELLFVPPQRGLYPFYLLAYQCPKDNWIIADPPEGKPHNADVMMAIVDECIERFPVDEDRITIVGVSSGGTGTWNTVARFPDRFAGAAAIAATAQASKPAELKNLPIWTFINEVDDKVPWQHSEPVIDAINAAGGHAQLTVTSKGDGGYAHDSWNSAFLDYRLLDWLLEQRRGEFHGFNYYNPLSSFSRKLSRWTWKELGMQAALFVTIGFVVWSLLPARWKKSKKKSASTKNADIAEGPLLKTEQ